ncbi:hypothetical protein [Fluviispira multicolorata]|uniref:Uncharacterized protein n=1 Tax=Fluviispira multicolorata TaxID=2654512 RepID=A0A833JF49_9BACT|nr:hypothetical protein [Fluviispira multicolorata]KAB8032269.1 hypothetical protein GCL57_06365 [Fluviispira multicolorata]
MKKITLAFPIFVIITLIFIFYIFLPSNSRQNIEKASYIKEKKEVNIDKPIIIKHTQDIPKNENEISEADLKEIKEFVMTMKDNYSKLNFDKDFQEEISKLYERKKLISLIFKNILLDNSFAKKISEEEQAYARVFSIKALKEIALLGDKEPLVSTIQELSIHLQNRDILNNGEKADLEDLLNEYLDINDTKEITENIVEHLKTLGFNKNIKNKEIVGIYDNSFYFYLVGKIGREKAKKLLEKHIDS